MATDLAISPVPNDLLHLFNKYWPLFHVSTKEALLGKLRPHLIDCAHLIQCLEPQLFHRITTELQTDATLSSNPSPVFSTCCHAPTYTKAVPTASQPPPAKESRQRTTSAAQPLSTARPRRPPTVSKYLPGLPEDIRRTICHTTAKTFFGTSRDRKGNTDYFLALVHAEKNTWLNAIKQRFLSLGIFHLRERILHQGIRAHNGGENRWQHCTEKTAKVAIIDAAATNNPGIPKDEIEKVISRNISRGKRYMGLVREFSVSLVISLCPNTTDFYENRLPTEQNETRKAFISELKTGGAKTTAELGRDVLESACQQYLHWIYTDCEAWFNACGVWDNLQSPETIGLGLLRSGIIEFPKEDVLQIPTQSFSQSRISTQLLAPSLNMLAETALSNSSSNPMPSSAPAPTGYYVHPLSAPASSLALGSPDTQQNSSGQTSVDKGRDGDDVAASMDIRIHAGHDPRWPSHTASVGEADSGNGQKRMYNGEDTSTTKRRKSLSGSALPGLNCSVDTSCAEGSKSINTNLDQAAHSTNCYQAAFAPNTTGPDWDWGWTEVLEDYSGWDWYDAPPIETTAGSENQFRDEDLNFGISLI